MDDLTFNGRGPVEPIGNRDHAQGRAALLLTESLMHALLGKGIFSREDFITVVEGAAEVEHELIRENGSYPAESDGAVLLPLAAAFKRELES